MEHSPFTHVAPTMQAFPQIPQLASSACSSALLPSVGSPLQSVQPSTQTPIRQPPSEQIGPTVCERLGHVSPHPRQLETSLAAFVSHPLEASPSQLKKGLSHAIEHIPFEHEAVPPFEGQTAPVQAPQ